MRCADALLEVRGLTKRFGGLTAVAGLDFALHEGEILGLIGPNGAGKSTTFDLVAGSRRADAGEIRLAGEPIGGLAPHEIARRGVMRTFQHNRPFPGMTVVDNVMVGAHARFRCGLWSIVGGLPHARDEERAMRRRAEEIVEFVGLGDRRAADVATLSFGQGRLLEIARALAGEPRLVMLDEPAAGLAPAELERLAAILVRIAARGIAVLLIEHDMHFLLPLAERVVVLNFGAKIAEGTADEIRGHPAVIDAYLGDPTALVERAH
ncbi:MAG: ABC transporter ATP-binding protein [Burkholderiales bacterium]|nr:ABC transporter ATP-binding protein [Burkholderiales bacterium]